MKAGLTLLIVPVLAALIASATDTRTTRGRLMRTPPAVTELTLSPDTLLPVISADSLVIHGFDKPLRSTAETFFASNLTDTLITGITLDLVYHDMQGAMLHARRVSLPCSIPSGETRQLRVRAWDTQMTYYYRLTRVRPRSERAVEFDVTIFPREMRH